MKIRREVKIGIFAVATLLALYWGLNFLKGHDIFSRNKTYYAECDQANGIQTASAIVIKGFKVGVISDIFYDPQLSDKIVLEFSIKSRYLIPDNSKARIYSDGLMGGKAVEIALGDSQRHLEDGDTLRSEMDKGFFEMAGSEIEFAKQKLNTLVNDLTKTLGNIDKVLVDNTGTITSTISNLSQITGTINDVVQREANSVGEIVENLNVLSRTLSENSSRIDNIIANVAGVTDSLAHADIVGTVANLSSSIEEFDGVMRRINSGEGTLGKLITDRELYDSLVTASSNLSRLLEDMKKNPGRYVHLSVFGRRNK